MAGITASCGEEDERLGSLILINVVPGISVVGKMAINVVAGITELWVENSPKINCRDVTSIWEGRVPTLLSC